jgi:hypothetical protein
VLGKDRVTVGKGHTFPERCGPDGPVLVRLNRLGEIRLDRTKLIEAKQAGPRVRHHHPERSPVDGPVRIDGDSLPERVEREMELDVGCRRLLVGSTDPIRTSRAGADRTQAGCRRGRDNRRSAHEVPARQRHRAGLDESREG